MPEETLRRDQWDGDIDASGGVQVPPTPEQQPYPFVEPPHERNEETDDDEGDEDGPPAPPPPLQRRVLPVVAQVQAAQSAEKTQREKLAKAVSRDRGAKVEGKAPVKAAASAKAQPAMAAVPAAVPTPKRNLGLFGDMATVREKLDRSLAADGTPGIPFMQQTMDQCAFPLWQGHERFEEKRVCGCRVVLGKSWCPSHYQIVFDPMKNR